MENKTKSEEAADILVARIKEINDKFVLTQEEKDGLTQEEIDLIMTVDYDKLRKEFISLFDALTAKTIRRRTSERRGLCQNDGGHQKPNPVS